MRFAPPDPPLVDDGVLLRPPEPRDARAIARACADPELARWLPRLPHPYRLADAESFVAHAAEAWRRGDEAIFAVADPRGDRVVGMLALEPVRRRAGVEVGYWLAPAARGRGTMTRAVRLACAWAFASGWPRVEALVRPDNAASLAVCERAGFRREGVLRRALDDRGTLRDVVIVARLPDDPPSSFAGSPEG
jgi:RimJ/RimL family protein N-acetyltransferase